MIEKKIRVRFAPSPTGPLHMGGVRTALFNYLFAKKHGGDFLLRIEDTDQTRYVAGAEEYIIESLNWCNIPFNEGVGLGGDYGPYRQSERKEIYKQYADQLVSTDNAYYAFDTPEELENLRKELETQKITFQYNSESRKSLNNSLTLSKEEVDNRLSAGEPYVIRLKVPENENIEFIDIIRQTVVFHSSQVDDKVLFKSDGMPTYHLANVVDDYLMKISHVIRGEEWLSSTPHHVLLYRYLGWEKDMPEFAHLPLLLKPDGKGKLSKRDGDRLGFPVFPLQWKSPEGEISSGYRESGYFADSFINMLAFLGWNPGTEQEIFTLNELVDQFSLERVGKSGSKFDPDKTKWFNHQYLIAKSNEELAKLYMPFLQEKNISTNEEYVIKVCGLIKDRAHFVKEFWDHSNFFFTAPENYDEQVIKKRWKPDSAELLNTIGTIIESVNIFNTENASTIVKNYIEQNQLNAGQIMSGLRLVLVGSSVGPDIFEIITMIGKDETLKRIKKGIETIK